VPRRLHCPGWSVRGAVVRACGAFGENKQSLELYRYWFSCEKVSFRLGAVGMVALPVWSMVSFACFVSGRRALKVEARMKVLVADFGLVFCKFVG
jgi:hypothetical protein